MDFVAVDHCASDTPSSAVLIAPASVIIIFRHANMRSVGVAAFSAPPRRKPEMALDDLAVAAGFLHYQLPTGSITSTEN